MSTSSRRAALLAFALLSCWPAAQVAHGAETQSSALAAEPIRVGIMVDFSGPFSSVGTMVRQGVELYAKQHGQIVGGRQVEFLFRDINPGTAKAIGEELAVKDKARIFAGFALTPEAAAVASISKEAKIPTVLVLPSTPTLMNMSPYFIRSANNMPATVMPSAEWAFKQGKRRAYIAVSDYAPGYELQASFKKKFEELGGKVVAEDRIPLNTIDFSSFAERIARAKPGIVVIFVPNGAPSAGFIKALAAQGVMSSGTPVIGSAETDDTEQRYFDDNVLGAYSSIFYVPSLDNPENKAFKAQLAKTAGPDVIPNFAMVGAYDGMGVLYHMIEAQAGKPFDAAAAMNAAKGYEWKSPRGPAKIEPDTRDITQNEYIRQVQKVDGKRINIVVATYPMVKDPWPAAHPN